MSSRCLEWKSGFIKFGKNKRWEVNWNVRDWALPLEVSIQGGIAFYRILCVSLIVHEPVDVKTANSNYRRPFFTNSECRTIARIYAEQLIKYKATLMTKQSIEGKNPYEVWVEKPKEVPFPVTHSFSEFDEAAQMYGQLCKTRKCRLIFRQVNPDGSVKRIISEFNP